MKKETFKNMSFQTFVKIRYGAGPGVEVVKTFDTNQRVIKFFFLLCLKFCDLLFNWF